MSEVREYVSGPGFARRAVFAQSLRGVLIPSVLLSALFAVLTALLAVGGATDFVQTVWWAFALFFALYALLVVLALLAAYRSTRKHIPEGSRFTAQLRGTSLAFSGPLGTADVAYSAYRRVERRHGFVILRLRQSRLATVIPAELFHEGEFDRLVAAVADAAWSPVRNTDAPELDYWMVTDAAHVRQIARATTRYALTRPATLVVLVIVALPAVLGVLLTSLSVVLHRDPLVGLPPIIFSLVIIGPVIGLVYLAALRVHWRQNPAGSRLELGLTADGIAMRNAQYRTELPYSRVRGVRRRGAFTVLLTRPGSVIIPSRLLPPEAEQRLLAALRP